MTTVIRITPKAPFIFEAPPDGMSADTYWWESDMICVPFVASKTPRAFLRWLHELESKGKPVFFPTVINARLAKLLALRGYVPALWYIEELKEDALCLVRFP